MMNEPNRNYRKPAEKGTRASRFPKKPEDVKIGIYEKALPPDLSWKEMLETAERQRYDFVEMSIDESDTRLGRLDWSLQQRRDFLLTAADSPLDVPSICFSGHRRFPLGSHDRNIRGKSRELMRKAVDFAADLGIRVIQLAGYDVYYEDSDDDTNQWFYEGVEEAVSYASRQQVMLAMEIMDTAFMNSITAFMKLKEQLPSPWFTVYPDLGNLTAWGNDVERELTLGIEEITAVHLKDTLKVTADFPGQFRDVPFGKGCVDFADDFRILAELGYTGPFLIEMWTEKAENPEQEIGNARSWMIDRMREGGFVQ